MIKDYIENHPVFTRQELLKSCGNTQANANLLFRAKKAGKVVSVARGVYVSNTGRFRTNEVSPYAIAEKLGAGVVLAYSSALAFLVGTHDITSRVVFYTDSATRRIDWGGHEYVGYPRPSALSTKGHRLPDGATIELTDKEQTIIDCLARPDRCGGAEALLKSLSAIEFVNAEVLADKALAHSKSVTAKLGWLLDAKREVWNVPNGVLEKLNKGIKDKGPFYFARTHDTIYGSWHAKWRLYLPASERECEGWLEG